MTAEAWIHHRLKERPEDFRVEERMALRPKRNGAFRLYRLTKSGWNTIDLLVHIARRSRLSIDHFSFGGRKDREAVTTQFITVRSPRDLSCRDRDFQFESVGFVDERMRPERLLGNVFIIVVRDLDQAAAEAMAKNLSIVSRQGLTNYFDDQRFGAFDPAGGFAAPRILRGEWEEALRIHLTSVRAGEAEPRRARRLALRAQWGNWRACLGAAETVTARQIFELLASRSRQKIAFGEALNRIPREEMSMIFSSWQSSLWNEIAAEATRELAEETAMIRGAAGPYVFCTKMSPEAFGRYRRWVIPMPGPRPRIPDVRTADLYRDVLARAGFEERDLRIPSRLGSTYLKSFPRRLHLRPEGARIIDQSPDEMHPGRERLTIGFEVDRGSYGTMVVKRLSVRERS